MLYVSNLIKIIYSNMTIYIIQGSDLNNSVHIYYINTHICVSIYMYVYVVIGTVTGKKTSPLKIR